MKWITRTIQVLLFGLILSTVTYSEASVTLKVTANNPSTLDEREIFIKSYLPKGVRPEDVINADGLEIGYDVKRNQSYAHKTVILGAQETATYNIEIEDIWLIDEIELDGLINEADGLIEELKGTEYAEISAQIQADIRSKVSDIITRQDNALVFKSSPAQHMKAYDDNKKILNSVQSKVSDLEQFLSSVEKNKGKGEGTSRQTRAAMLMKAQMIKDMILNYGYHDETSCLVEQSLKSEGGRVNLESPRTVLMNIKFENPSSTKQLKAPFHLFLMKETKAGDVVDPKNLKVGFDFNRNLYYLFNNEITLEPDEIRDFDITLNNRWSIDRTRAYGLKVYIESLSAIEDESTESISIKQMAGQGIDNIYGLLDKTDATELTEGSVVSFRNDQRKLEGIRQVLQRMEDLLIKQGISPELKVMEQELVCQDVKAEGESPKRSAGTSGILEAVRAMLRGGTVFSGKSLSSKSTWQIINYIIIFLGVISGVFYFVNIREQKSAMFDPLTGAFARAYTQERFREELRVAKGGNNTCSLLVMDIDKFKGINDTYGHIVGDTVLKEFIIAVRKGIRATDILGRFGGDEFMIVLPTGKKDIALRIAESIVRIVEGTAVRINPQLTLTVTASIGVATYPEDSTTAEDLFNKADQALYKVKKRGGNGAEVFGEKV